MKRLALLLVLAFSTVSIAAPPVAPKEKDYPEMFRKRTVTRSVETTVRSGKRRKVRRVRKSRVRRFRLFRGRRCRRC